MSHPCIPCNFSEFETAAMEFLAGFDVGVSRDEACNGFKCLTLMMQGLDYASSILPEVEVAERARLAHDQAEQKMRANGFPTPVAYADHLADLLFH